jgi:excisionase family DNA binding protein
MSAPTVYQFLNEGVLPSFRLGKRRLIRVDDLKAFLDNCQKAQMQRAKELAAAAAAAASDAPVHSPPELGMAPASEGAA